VLDAAPAPAITPVPAITIDAGVIRATTPDAAPPPPDAAPAHAAPPDAPAKRHRPHATPHAGSSTTTVPPGCDRSVDTDCDGIPDVR
jgi:hypothetical protein